MKLLSFIPSWLSNKFLLTAVVFIVWMVFFDHNDIITQFERRKELRSLVQSKQFYTRQIAEERKALDELKTNPAAIEKFAREKYLMKRDNEDLFIIHTPENK